MPGAGRRGSGKIGGVTVHLVAGRPGLKKVCLNFAMRAELGVSLGEASEMIEALLADGGLDIAFEETEPALRFAHRALLCGATLSVSDGDTGDGAPPS